MPYAFQPSRRIEDIRPCCSASSHSTRRMRILRRASSGESKFRSHLLEFDEPVPLDPDAACHRPPSAWAPPDGHQPTCRSLERGPSRGVDRDGEVQGSRTCLSWADHPMRLHGRPRMEGAKACRPLHRSIGASRGPDRGPSRSAARCLHRAIAAPSRGRAHPARRRRCQFSVPRCPIRSRLDSGFGTDPPCHRSSVRIRWRIARLMSSASPSPNSHSLTEACSHRALGTIVSSIRDPGRDLISSPMSKG